MACGVYRLKYALCEVIFFLIGSIIPKEVDLDKISLRFIAIVSIT